MKRSEVNAIIQNAVGFMKKANFSLPAFAYWTARDWARQGKAAAEIKTCMLGWDITDFGLGDFRKAGLVLFTVRNGHMKDRRFRSKTYCEKIMVAEEAQVTPMHFHWHKMEDIINRAGGELAIQCYNATPSGQLARSRVTVSVDGVQRTIAAGGIVRLQPGQSICLPPRLYHKFWATKGKGRVLIGEVSKINDDTCDNRFYAKVGRFPAIEEDVPARYLLFSDYPR